MTTKKRIGPLFTDLYELTMAAAYYKHNLLSDATFSLFVRDHKSNRNYFVASGLENALKELESFHFSEAEIAFLKDTGLFANNFLDYLKRLAFTGQVIAMPEGTIFFANEPVMEITGPIIEAQIIETFLLNTIGFPTMIASKAARCVHAAKGCPLLDFSLRRTHGQDAGLNAARSTYIAGFASTSNVLAGKLYGIPISGTMAHSFIKAFDNECDAFRAYAKTFPKNSVFLIDTYDTLEGASNAVKIAKEMKRKGLAPIGIRLDSGDMTKLSIQVREILDKAGLKDIKIFASSGFDEFKIDDAVEKGAKIDSFGVGTRLGVSADAPYLDIVYKLVRFKGRNVKKLSPGKITLAGEKQVFRISDISGMYQEDIIGLRNETIEGGKPLLEKVMKDGKRVHPHPSLQEIRKRFSKNFSCLDDRYKMIQDAPDYPAKISRSLKALQA
ncbi:MAG: nicotinate phosphoribosyltransferase [Deltaproteobacteria bacterium]|nr:nicotinate phosphoribosyltransferase [Deltaproteobacteria bacterium]